MKYLMVIALMLSANANAGYKSANEFLNECENEESYYDTGVCAGYVRGVVDAVLTLNGWSKVEADAMFCLPEHSTVGQAIKVVVKYIEERPEGLHYTASSVVINALYDAFPCE